MNTPLDSAIAQTTGTGTGTGTAREMVQSKESLQPVVPLALGSSVWNKPVRPLSPLLLAPSVVTSPSGSTSAGSSSSSSAPSAASSSSSSSTTAPKSSASLFDSQQQHATEPEVVSPLPPLTLSPHLRHSLSDISSRATRSVDRTSSGLESDSGDDSPTDDARGIEYRSYWTHEEDETLKKLVLQYGPRNWRWIASHLPGRSNASCRERWYGHLDDSIKKKSWTPEEDATILSLQKRMGNRWRQISKYLPGRTDNQVKNRYYSAMRRRSRRDRFLMESARTPNTRYRGNYARSSSLPLPDSEGLSPSPSHTLVPSVANVSLADSSYATSPLSTAWEVKGSPVIPPLQIPSPHNPAQANQKTIGSTSTPSFMRFNSDSLLESSVSTLKNESKKRKRGDKNRLEQPKRSKSKPLSTVREVTVEDPIPQSNQFKLPSAVELGLDQVPSMLPPTVLSEALKSSYARSSSDLSADERRVPYSRNNSSSSSLNYLPSLTSRTNSLEIADSNSSFSRSSSGLSYQKSRSNDSLASTLSIPESLRASTDHPLPTTDSENPRRLNKSFSQEELDAVAVNRVEQQLNMLRNVAISALTTGSVINDRLSNPAYHRLFPLQPVPSVMLPSPTSMMDSLTQNAVYLQQLNALQNASAAAYANLSTLPPGNSGPNSTFGSSFGSTFGSNLGSSLGSGITAALSSGAGVNSSAGSLGGSDQGSVMNRSPGSASSAHLADRMTK
eukprot:GILJ01001306.1.p1 GENE.GILJ01001306.1~~GILJ01001306.1.p1  ORF type:complete len:728 (-),score=116.36 GILJ01001306.1:291-2474(-)